MKKIIVMMLVLACCFTTVFANGAAETTGKQLVGVSMPTKSLQRWNQDGANMKAQLEAAGYAVDLEYAGDNDVALQVSQIENMVNNGCKVIVVAAIDGSSLGTPLKAAQDAGIPVIAYDRLLMNTDAVTYYATFDNWDVGVKQGEYIEQALGLKEGKGPYNMECFTGDPGDNNINFFYDGALSVLDKYVKNGQLVIPSGQYAKATVATPDWSAEKAQSRMEAIISSYYAGGKKLDVVLCSNDSTAQGVATALSSAYNGPWPVITGQDCDKPNVKLMIAGKQSMSIFKDTRTLASKVVEMIEAILNSKVVPVNDTKTYDNGVKVVPSYLCEPVFGDINNYKELLLDSGYYTEADLM